MGRSFILLLLISCSLPEKRSDTSGIFLKPTAWFATNKDSVFYKSDSIMLIQHLNNYGPEEFFIEDAVSFFDSSDIVRLTLMPEGELRFSIYFPKENAVTKSTGKYTWEYDIIKNLVRLSKNDQPFFCFQPISTYKIKVKSRVTEVPDSVNTNRLLVKRINCR
jgi:hypothetical protein